MNTLRSLAFTLWLYLSMPLFAIGLSPALLLPHRHAMAVIKLWARCVLFGLRWIAGVKVEFRGLEHRYLRSDVNLRQHMDRLVSALADLP